LAQPKDVFSILLANTFRSDFADVFAEETLTVPLLCELAVIVPREELKPAELAKEDPLELEP
jgi:hypothetical protein